ncbi:hypothetical protein A2U01_0072754, partial [Trifolium medium]|nr:hypothetical protein [Trifolium medium]
SIVLFGCHLISSAALAPLDSMLAFDCYVYIGDLVGLF